MKKRSGHINAAIDDHVQLQRAYNAEFNCIHTVIIKKELQSEFALL